MTYIPTMEMQNSEAGNALDCAEHMYVRLF